MLKLPGHVTERAAIGRAQKVALKMKIQTKARSFAKSWYALHVFSKILALICIEPYWGYLFEISEGKGVFEMGRLRTFCISDQAPWFLDIIQTIFKYLQRLLRLLAASNIYAPDIQWSLNILPYLDQKKCYCCAAANNIYYVSCIRLSSCPND